MNDATVTLAIKANRGTDFVSIQFHERGPEDCMEYNQLLCDIEVSVAGHVSKLRSGIWLQALEEFREQLEDFFSGQRHEAVLKYVEDFEDPIHLRVKHLESGSDEVLIIGRTCTWFDLQLPEIDYMREPRASLSFRFVTTQETLRETKKSLETILSTWPLDQRYLYGAPE